MNDNASPWCWGAMDALPHSMSCPCLALCEDVYRNGFLGGKPACLGQFPCQVRLPTSKRSRMPLMNNSRQTLLENGEGAPCV